MVGETMITRKERNLARGYFETALLSKRIEMLDHQKEGPINGKYGPEIELLIRITECVVTADQLTKIQDVIDQAALDINGIMGW